MKTLVCLTALSCVLTSCRKNIIKFDRGFEGFWAEKKTSVCDMRLVIDHTGHANYFSPTSLSDCRRIKNVSGKAVANRNSIRIGVHVYHLSQFPTTIDTVSIIYDGGGGALTGKSIVTMQIDGHTFYKIIGK